ncbi:MAG: UDP-3-O-(3-hydroxymyristoyl)glucosamine N-acyltransferase [Variibacter sp.]|nr:UDP-3-O-(3-hydroxymyristoyl)glucosamine N-acyltransferase [Variibacter sp.]
MNDTQFHRPASTLSVAEIARLTGAVPAAGADQGRRISNIAALDLAGPDDLAFIDNPRYAPTLSGSRAGVCLTAPRFAGEVPRGTVAMVVPQAYRAFVLVARQLFPDALRPSALAPGSAVAPGAIVDKAARLEPGVSVDPAAVVGAGAEIGSGTTIGAGAVIGPGVRIGRDCAIGASTTITHALIGDRTIIHPGCRIGQDGFGFVMGAKGHQKVPQVGRVIIQDEVEIGANCAVDRGGIRDTIVGEGTKIDNMVQVGHNVMIGRHCVIVAQTGISGSATLGDFVVLGARVGVRDHVTIGDGAQIAALSIVRDDVPPGARWGGHPAKPVREWLREMATVETLTRRAAKSETGEIGDAGEGEQQQRTVER